MIVRGPFLTDKVKYVYNYGVGRWRKKMNKSAYHPILWGILFFVMAACQPATPEPPTLIPFPPTETPTIIPPTAEGPTPTPPFVPRTTSSNPSEQAFLRLVHAAPDTPNVDVYVELLSVAVDLGFTRFTDQSGIVAGNYNLRIVPAGASVESEPLYQTPISIQGGQSLLFILTGTNDALNLITFDETTPPLRSTESRIHVLHAIPRGPDFTVQQDNTDITGIISFGGRSEPLILPSGQTNLALQSGTTRLLDYPISLNGRSQYTLIVAGRPDDLTSVTIVPLIVETAGLAQIQIFNASSAIGSFDAYIGATPIANNVTYGNASVIQQVTSNVYEFTLYPVGSDPNTIQPILSSQIFANPDDDLKLIVVGEASSLQLLTYYPNTEPTDEGTTRIAFVNTLETVPRARVVVNGIESFDIFYGAVSDELTIPAGMVSLSWSRIEGEADGDALENPNPLDLLEGQTYLYLFAARQFDVPLIFEMREVGTRPVLTFSEQLEAMTPTLPTRVRLINAISDGQTVNFYIDDVLAAADIARQSSSSMIITESGSHVLTVRDSATNTLLARDERFYDPSNDYTAIVFGQTTSSIDMTVIDDRDIKNYPARPSIRLINVSIGPNVLLGAGFSPPEPNPFQPQAGDGFRLPVPLGITPLSENIEPLYGSRLQYVLPGIYHLRVIDNLTSRLALTIPFVELQEGLHYDIIAYQRVDSPQVEGFIIPYP